MLHTINANLSGISVIVLLCASDSNNSVSQAPEAWEILQCISAFWLRKHSLYLFNTHSNAVRLLKLPEIDLAKAVLRVLQLGREFNLLLLCSHPLSK